MSRVFGIGEFIVRSITTDENRLTQYVIPRGYTRKQQTLMVCISRVESKGDMEMTNLELLRSNAGMSQVELGRLIKASRIKISQFENGWYTRIPDNTLVRLQSIFGTEWTGESLLKQVPIPDPTEKSVAA